MIRMLNVAMNILVFNSLLALVFLATSNSNNQAYMPIELHLFVSSLENSKSNLLVSLFGFIFNTSEHIQIRSSKSTEKMLAGNPILTTRNPTVPPAKIVLNQFAKEKSTLHFKSSTILAHHLFRLLTPTTTIKNGKLFKKPNKSCCLNETTNQIYIKTVYSFFFGYIALLSVGFVHAIYKTKIFQ